MQFLFEGINKKSRVVSIRFNRGSNLTTQQTADNIASMTGCKMYHWVETSK